MRETAEKLVAEVKKSLDNLLKDDNYEDIADIGQYVLGDSDLVMDLSYMLDDEYEDDVDCYDDDDVDCYDDDDVDCYDDDE